MTPGTGLKTRAEIDPDRMPVHRLACTEVWGGNDIVNSIVEVPGFIGWVYSRPLRPATTGGDVYYLVVCSKGLLSRIVLADVAGHGRVSTTAATLRNLLQKHMNVLDQSFLMQELNEAFQRYDDPDEVQYATAAVFGYFCRTGELIFTNAGHPPALWYHAMEQTWDWLHDETPYRQAAMNGVPLGLIPGTQYLQSAVRLSPGDLLVLYTDGISESTNGTGEELGYQGLLRMAIPLEAIRSAREAGQTLLTRVSDFRGASQISDDESLIVLQQVASNGASFAP